MSRSLCLDGGKGWLGCWWCMRAVRGWVASFRSGLRLPCFTSLGWELAESGKVVHEVGGGGRMSGPPGLGKGNQVPLFPSSLCCYSPPGLVTWPS